MAEVFDFGLQQHKIKMDGKFFENNLFAVAGDTGRRLEVQLLDSNNMVQNTTGISLRLNANVAGQATYAEATLVDATKGLYELDLPNGMLIAPGNWQFQWQIIGTSGEKIHSFAFVGSIGSNLSEGGSEATNFYLNVDDLKQMQEDLVNGTFNSEVLETNIAEKLTDLETQYAPKLTEVTAQLAEKDNLTNKHIDVLNTKIDTVGVTNLANFAGQELGSAAPIGFIEHHYTDGGVHQIDNVGENNVILTLKNANNPSRRPDKPADFVGTGNFLQLLEHRPNGQTSKRMLTIGKNGELYWFDGQKPITLGQNKTDDNTPAFTVDIYNLHTKLFEIKNAYGTEFLISHNKNNNILEITGGTKATGGMHIQSILGALQLTGGNGQVILNGSAMVYESTTYQTIATIRNGSTEFRPTKPRVIGEFYFDTYLNKPIWCKTKAVVDGVGVVTTSAIWVDAMGSVV